MNAIVRLRWRSLLINLLPSFSLQDFRLKGTKVVVLYRIDLIIGNRNVLFLLCVLVNIQFIVLLIYNSVWLWSWLPCTDNRRAFKPLQNILICGDIPLGADNPPATKYLCRISLELYGLLNFSKNTWFGRILSPMKTIKIYLKKLW